MALDVGRADGPYRPRAVPQCQPSAQTCFAVFAEFAIELSRQAELASVADALRDVAYIFSARTFSGRVAMVMGAKNMTMTEIQDARRIGECSPRSPAEF